MQQNTHQQSSSSMPLHTWFQHTSRKPLLLRIILFCAFLLLYLSTLTHVHTFDALSYVLDVDRKPWQELFHPHHLAYGLLGAVVRMLTVSLALGDSVLLPLQVVNAVAGAIGVVLLFDVVYRVLHRFDLALCAGVLFGASYAAWYYAVEVEVYTIAALFLVGCLGLIVRLIRLPRSDTAMLLGLVQGLALLFHQTNALLCVPVAVALLVAKASWRKRLMAAWSYGVVLLVISAGSYILVGFGISQHESLSEFVGWMTSYAHTGWWGSAVTSETWEDLGKGLSETLAQPSGALFGLLLLGFVILGAQQVAQRYWRLALCLLAWVLTYGAFFIWWEPDNIEFWIASLPPAILLLMLALHGLSRRLWHPGVVLVLVIALTIASINYDAIRQRGNAATNINMRIVENIAQQSHKEDLLLVSDELHALYLTYYEQRDHSWSLNQAMFEAEGDWQQACQGVLQRIRMAEERGAAVLIADQVLHPKPGKVAYSDPVLQRFGLTQQQVTACFTPYLDDFVPLQQEIVAGLSYYRLPSARDVANGNGWYFVHGRRGWRAKNISQETFDGGWRFMPGVDPQLISPPMTVDTARYHAIEMRIDATSTTTRTEKFELFFINEQGLVDMEHSVARTLKRDTGPQEYRITLEGREGWEGIITGFRLDPIGTGDGDKIQVDWVRLIHDP